MIPTHGIDRLEQIMTVVGAFARIDGDDMEGVRHRLETLPGVSTFDLADPGKVGILIEAETVDQAHHCLTQDIRAVEGVLGAWPVYLHDEEEEAEAQ
jgi:nitrate reductase NapAB chaperone NapD